MESGDETSTSISETSEDTIDLQNLVTANPSPSSPSPLSSHLSTVIPPIESPSSSFLDSSQSANMASVVSTSTGHEMSSNFNMNAYASVTTLATGTFNDWKLRLTTVMGAHRLSK